MNEHRKAHRTGKEDIPAMFKRDDEYHATAAEKEYAADLRANRVEEKPAMFRDEYTEYNDLPMFRRNQEVKVVAKPAPISKPAPAEEESVDAPKLKSHKGLFVYENKEGQFVIKQTGEEKLVGSFSTEQEALSYAQALKRVNGVAVKVRGKDNRIYSL